MTINADSIVANGVGAKEGKGDSEKPTDDPGKVGNASNHLSEVTKVTVNTCYSNEKWAMYLEANKNRNQKPTTENDSSLRAYR